MGRPLPKGSKRLREGARPTRSARMVLTYTRLLAGRVSLVDVLREKDRRELRCNAQRAPASSLNVRFGVSADKGRALLDLSK